MHIPEAIHQTEPAVIHRRHRRRQFLRAFALVCVVLVAGWFILLLLVLGQVAAATLEARDAIFDTATEVRSMDFSEGQKNLSRALDSIQEAEQSLFLLERVWFFPGFQKDFSTVKGTLVASEQLIDSLIDVLSLGQDVAQLSELKESSVTFNELPPSTKLVILERLSTASDDFDLLSSRLQIASEELTLLSESKLASPFIGVLNPLVENMNLAKSQLKVASVLSDLLPEFSGFETPKTHLLLFLNNDELRPGGGFIGTYGIMKVSNGEVLETKTADVYSLDSAPKNPVTAIPPVPFQKYNATSTWYFRDSNWSPDFAESAKQSIAAFESESGTNVDSVIGFTPTFASALLDYLGPIQVAGQTFTAENVPELIEYQVEKGFQENGIPVAQRKEILADLVDEVQSRLVSLPFSKWGDVFTIVTDALLTKQAAVFSENNETQQTLINFGWAGTISPSTTDVQLFVDANLASLKSDPVVQRSIRYSLFKNESGTWIGRTSVTYDHKGTFDWRTTRYRSYARLYVPKESELIRAIGLNEGPEVFEELGRRVFGGFVSVEPGEERTVVYEYKLSDAIVQAITQGSYGLTFYKQMGARDYALTLDLDFDKNISNADPAENHSEWGDDRYRLNTKLSQDLGISIK
ncbi:DUF4012 domain-containing protein [Candidatus Uhrbacteria bacterium]|nr:DUF4012 domain-containing protein [Candidatus Uhrbacteria bacterium]